MSRSDLLTYFCIALAFILTMLLGLYYLVGLYLNEKISSYGVETGWLLLAVGPGALVGITLIILGRRSAYWLWVFLPGVLVWTLRPWPRGCCEWELLGAWPYLAAYGWTIISAVRTETGLPPATIIGIVGTLVVLLLCALITGRTIRQAKKDIGAGMRDGALKPGTASGGGLPQASWATAQEVRARFDHPGGIVLGEHTNPIDDTPDFTPDKPRTWARRQGRGPLITMNPDRWQWPCAGSGCFCRLQDLRHRYPQYPALRRPAGGFRSQGRSLCPHQRRAARHGIHRRRHRCAERI